MHYCLQDGSSTGQTKAKQSKKEEEQYRKIPLEDLKYTETDLIGVGHFTSVYKAKHIDWGQVAVKEVLLESVAK